MKATGSPEIKDHENLLQIAFEIGCPKEHVRKLLWLINAPASLIAFIQIADNLRQLFRLAAAEIDFDIDDWLDSCLSLLDYIVENEEHTCKVIGQHLAQGSKEHNGKLTHPMRGNGMVRYPMYTSMWNIHESFEDRDTYRLLQAHILIAHMKLMEDITTIESYECYAQQAPILGKFNSSAINACSLTRDMSLISYSDHFQELMEEQDYYAHHSPSTPELRALLFLPHEEFYAALVSKHEEQSGSIQTDCTKYFGLFFIKSYIEQETKKRSGGGGSRSHDKKLAHDGYVDLSPFISKLITGLGEIDDPDGNWGSQYLIREKLELDNDSELEPLESDTGEELYLTKFEEKPQSILSVILAARGQVRQLTMANQLLRGRWGNMTVWEVAQLMLICGSMFREICGDSQEINESKLIILEAIGLIMTMLWTGSSLERARKIALTISTDKIGSNLAYITDKKEWRIKPFLPEYTTKPSKEQRNKSRNKTTYIYLPDLFNIGGYLTKIAKLKGISKTSAPIFTRHMRSYKKAIKEVTKELPEGHRVTEVKISKYLFHLIASETSGDVADAVLTTGNYHHLGQTLLHYTTPSADYIRDIYTKSIESVINEIYQEAYDKTPPECGTATALKGFYLGSRLCPKRESIITMVEQLSSQIYEGRSDYDTESFIQYHNIYTIYTSQMFAYATGVRAIKSPFIHIEEVDEETGLAVISDKDGKDFYNSRLVWLPDSVRKQLSYYSNHRDYVMNELIPKKYPHDLADTPFLFLMNSDLSIIELRPKNIRPLLTNIFPMPLNVNRRFLRTEMKERGCPIEIINCFMGHWSLGEEPWGKFSSLSFHDYVQTLKQHIIPILDMLTWKPIQSRIFK